MIFSAKFRMGDASQPVKITLFQALFGFLLSPFAIILQLIIAGLVILLNLIQLDMYHIVFRVTMRDIEMPNGEIIKAKNHE